jgi:DNA polymerase III delta prime subunit
MQRTHSNSSISQTVKQNKFVDTFFNKPAIEEKKTQIIEKPEPKTTFITKYRPYFIDDFCVDPKFKSVLRTLREIDDLNLLIIGSQSSGKTSILYAIIREYYNLGKTQSLPENNILFINNLKEQGINYYRNEMKTFCQSHSSIYGKKKMIIVDDLDTISEQCQQVFRNYIDKYKNNVHFVSACSNVQKVIESIQSRIHIIRIESPTDEQITEIMEKIITQEGIYIEEEAKEYLLRFSNHSIRELMNHLEKIYILDCGIATKPVSLDTCKKLCSNISFHQFEIYIKKLKSGNLIDSVYILYEIHDYGYSVIDILDYFFVFIKTTDNLSEDEKYLIIPLLCKYITIFHSIHESIIELALITKDIYKVLNRECE